MSITVKTIKCPQCGGNVMFEEGHDKLFCSYCGANIIITNENEHIYRHINEADIKRAETERIQTMANIESDKSSKTIKIAKLVAVGILIIVGIVLMIIGSIGKDGPTMLALVGMYPLLGAGFIGMSIPKDKSKKSQHLPNGIEISESIANFYGGSYEALEALLRSRGFTNITCIPLNDINAFNFIQHPKGQVNTLSINGNEHVEEGDIFPRDATIVITYHS